MFSPKSLLPLISHGMALLMMASALALAPGTPAVAAAVMLSGCGWMFLAALLRPA